jgi:nickel-dependent lactate racemase
MVIGQGFADRHLTSEEISRTVHEGLGSLAVDGKRVLIIIPDGTRTMPMPQMFDLFERELSGRVAALDYLVALGTHPMMDDEHLGKLVGRQVVDGKVGKINIFNHHWEVPENFATLGVIPAQEISRPAEQADSRLRPDHHLRSGFPA